MTLSLPALKGGGSRVVLLNGIPEGWRGDWEPDAAALTASRDRIRERQA